MRRHKISVGDRVTVPTPRGPVTGTVLVRRAPLVEVWIPEWRRTQWWPIRDAQRATEARTGAACMDVTSAA